MSIIRVLVATLLALPLLGCGGRPDGVLNVVNARAEGTSEVQMLVATTRKPSTSDAIFFTGERDQTFNFADLRVSIPPSGARKIGEVQWPDGATGDPAKQFVVVKAERLDESAALRTFHERLRNIRRRKVLVFVHGYNTRFGEAVFRFAQIIQDANLDAVPVLFTWPSRGQLLAYTYDRESANYSRDALERVISFLQKDTSVGEIDILAHSMGNWVTLEALRQNAIRNGSLPSKLKNVMLAAPDVDIDVFRRQIIEIGEKRPQFTMFVSRDDSALAVSQRIWGGVPRVGAVDPTQQPYADMFAQQKIIVVDLSAIDTPDRLGHNKFAESPEIVQSLGRRLASGQSFDDGKAGVGDRIVQATTGAASTVGSVAGLAITAPLAIVDGRTREGLSEQIGEVRENLKATVGVRSGY